jgi:hypothetical protein
VLFFRQHTYRVLVGILSQRTLASIIVCICIVFGLVAPVSAFYFDFHYFETDKLVYEVGETINMVAELIADFSGDGWCYVSFAVATNQGPAFSNLYYISPSSDVRHFNSSYTILPEDTSPGVNGAQAFVIFNVEIYDSYSQGEGDTIVLNITRGHLSVLPLSPLNIEFNTNSTLDFKVASAHNQSIPYRDSPVTVTLRNSTSDSILQIDTTTSSDGEVWINWTDTTGPPGDYTVTIAGDGTESFLPFSESFPLVVTRAVSNLTILSAPPSIHCQTPDGSQTESADIVVNQKTLDGQPISDSTILWSTIFSSGIMTTLGNGIYSVSIPITVEPGLYSANFTAVNPLYRNESGSVIIDVTPYVVYLSTANAAWSTERGNNVTLTISINSTSLQSQLIPIEIFDSSGEINTTVSVTANSRAEITFPISSNTSLGPHTMSIELLESAYSVHDPIDLEINIYGVIDVNVEFGLVYYGETAQIDINATDDNGQSVEIVDLRIYADSASPPFFRINNADATSSIEVPFLLNIYPGLHILHLYISSPWCQEANTSQSVTIWMRTSIVILIGDPNPLGPTSLPSTDYDSNLILSTISSGSIINPPPILLSETTSTESPTTLETSLESCPRLSSGTSNRSTDLANSLISESGNGHAVLNRSDFRGGTPELLAINSSTDLDVQPYDIIPHSADS